MTSTAIYDIATQKLNLFRPTYLFIKKHKTTGLMYFGKTTRTGRRFENYHGSGLYWKRHLEQHGKIHVETLWWCLFTDRETLLEFALAFSKQEDIGSDISKWANLKPENGLDGFTEGHQYSLGKKTFYRNQK